MSYLLYDLEVYAYRFASGALVDLDWGDGDWTVVCRHQDALVSFIDHAQDLLNEFEGFDLFLVRGDRRNYRYDIWPAYKANRKDRRRPPGYGAFLKSLSEVAKSRGWLTGGFKNVEGDDVLGIIAEPDDVIVSGDKDMLTLPGKHWRDGELIEVSRWDADVAFYKQTLVGDTSDNYPGCPGIGDKNKLFKSKEWLSSTTEKELWACVLGQYLKAGFDESYAITQARCARILRRDEFDHSLGTPHLWEPPVT